MPLDALAPSHLSAVVRAAAAVGAKARAPGGRQRARARGVAAVKRHLGQQTAVAAAALVAVERHGRGEAGARARARAVEVAHGERGQRGVEVTVKLGAHRGLGAHKGPAALGKFGRGGRGLATRVAVARVVSDARRRAARHVAGGGRVVAPAGDGVEEGALGLVQRVAHRGLVRGENEVLGARRAQKCQCDEAQSAHGRAAQHTCTCQGRMGENKKRGRKNAPPRVEGAKWPRSCGSFLCFCSQSRRTLARRL